MTIRQRLIVTTLTVLMTLTGSTMLATRSAAQDELPGAGGCNAKKCVGDACTGGASFNCVAGKAYYSISTGEYLGCSGSGTGTACCSGSAC